MLRVRPSCPGRSAENRSRIRPIRPMAIFGSRHQPASRCPETGSSSWMSCIVVTLIRKSSADLSGFDRIASLDRDVGDFPRHPRNHRRLHLHGLNDGDRGSPALTACLSSETAMASTTPPSVLYHVARSSRSGTGQRGWRRHRDQPQQRVAGLECPCCPGSGRADCPPR